MRRLFQHHDPRARWALALTVAALLALVAQPSWGAEPQPTATPGSDEPPISATDRDHWAFRPLTRVAIPLPGTADVRAALRSPVDAFIAAAQAKRELATGIPQQADPEVLLRRLTLQLTGIPPTPAARAEFLASRAPDAYEQQLDRLFASPHHGDHVSQGWLDLARFAETDGFEHDQVRPEAWRYRDWVAEAINRDLPYDEFVRQQLAGDELAAESGGKAAVQFCLSGPDMPDQNDQAQRRHDLLNELTGAVGSVFLGLQLGCAQCHDHKYDPLSQADFFRLRAFFESSLTVARDQPAGPLKSGVWTEPARLWLRGDHLRPGPRVTAEPPRVVRRDATEFVPLPAPASPRAALAHWLTAPEQPLFARVIVNRIWREQFGRGLSETPSDFGLLGEEPSHPELLEYLARELPRWGWSLKRLRRELLSCAAYRQPSRVTAAAMAARAPVRDPENRLLWRFAPRRLPAEALRDSLLHVSGLLTSERGGPGVMPPLPPELTQTLLKNQWKASARPADHYKRSLYLFARRNLRYPIFEAFDRPEANASCAARHPSTTALQSLLLLNSAETLTAARHLAGFALLEGEEPPEWIAAVHLRALGKPPTASEAAAAIDFLRRQAEIVARDSAVDGVAEPRATPLPHFSGDARWAAAVVDYCLALLSSADFAYLD